LSWQSTRDAISILIAKKKYPKAAKLLRKELHGEPGNVFMQQQLAEVLVRLGEKREALGILNCLAEEFASQGFVSKAIATLKKMQRVNPQATSLEKRISDLIVEQRKPTTQTAEPEEGGIAIAADDGPDLMALVDDQPLELELSDEDKTAPEKPKSSIKSPLFDDFSDEELVAVIKGLNLSTFESGEIVVTEGEPGTSMFVLASGFLRVYVRNARGQNAEVRLLEAGSFFGEISLISKQPRSATLTCASPCELLELNMEALKEITSTHPKVPLIINEFYQRRRNSPEEQQARS